MATITRDGVRITYQLHGPVTDRPPLLLTHGFGASGRMWDANVSALVGDRPVITWDMRGHGASDAPDDPSLYSHAACVGDMAALLDSSGAQRAVLGGMSLGGYLSLVFHLRHPERVAGLLLVDTGPGYRNDAARDGWNRWARGRADALDAEGLAALPRGREQAHAEHFHGATGIAHVARGVLVQRDSTVIDSLSAIAAPTLVVVGENDTPFRPAAEVMAERIPGARKVVLAGAGHAANMDAPEEFNAAVRVWLDTI